MTLNEEPLLQKAWDEGFSARRCGAKDHENPYPISDFRVHNTIFDRLHFAWARGYTCGAFEGCKSVDLGEKP